MSHVPTIRARPVGRSLRLLAGVALVFEGSRHLIAAESDLLVGVVLVFVLVLAFYAGLHVVISRFFARVNRWLGAALAIAPVAAVFLLGNVAGQLGTLLFVGVSLLFTAARADAGCEVMTLPGMVMGKRTHLACIAFSPVDWIEGRLSEPGRETS